MAFEDCIFYYHFKIIVFFFFSYTDGICDKKTLLDSLTETYNDIESLTRTKAKRSSILGLATFVVSLV